MDPQAIVRRAFAQGFEIGQASTLEADRLRVRLARAEQEADFWFLRAHYSEQEISEMVQAAISAAFEVGGVDMWADDADPSASWSTARALSGIRDRQAVLDVAGGA